MSFQVSTVYGLAVEPTVFGCRQKRGAEQLALHIAMDLESPAYTDDNFAVGISYGFRKAFDLILSDIMLATMERVWINVFKVSSFAV